MSRYREFNLLRIIFNDLPGVIDVIPHGRVPEYFIYVDGYICPSLPRLTESNLERHIINFTLLNCDRFK
ncbi:hypothetical protein OnM2_071039 [Erysiphe neolycopersici]|uniref:Uncharacterized protein n=1 Tax=Erysiphe neolycopersici TaxID=212602 RepID=A0A420HK26_9PEZI|nr:hypothetical protein OnM2_071039 [Erysiphe neolycopersici]